MGEVWCGVSVCVGVVWCAVVSLRGQQARLRLRQLKILLVHTRSLGQTPQTDARLAGLRGKSLETRGMSLETRGTQGPRKAHVKWVNRRVIPLKPT